jgi:cellulose synthase/poly-beta-1,6-N-acetylglucosamine synthase-like glycosyltransferase
MTVIFWILIGIVGYSYLGYTLLLYALNLLKKRKHQIESTIDRDFEPEVTLFVAAYNEIDIVNEKVNNSFQLDYPKQKIIHLWITDGSDDGTPEMLRKYENLRVLHQHKREGKIGAMNRGMQFVTTPIVIFSDANSMLSENAVREIVRFFANPETGCVAGEKQIIKQKTDKAVSSGEGFYWQYESYIKKLESNFNTVIGAAGELFAIRANLYQAVEPDTILDDFVIFLRIAEKKYKIKYASEAIAIESSSAGIAEEMKRKIRIAAGCIQTLIRFRDLLNPFKYGMFSLQYISHKVIRWTIVPFAFPIIFLLNILIFFNDDTIHYLYKTLLQLQIIFYLFAILGYALKNIKFRFRYLFIPYYLVIMNIAIIKGMLRYFSKKQTVNWEKVKRMR